MHPVLTFVLNANKKTNLLQEEEIENVSSLIKRTELQYMSGEFHKTWKLLFKSSHFSLNRLKLFLVLTSDDLYNFQLGKKQNKTTKNIYYFSLVLI